jgi:hypothetical protein
LSKSVLILNPRPPTYVDEQLTHLLEVFCTDRAIRHVHSGNSAFHKPISAVERAKPGRVDSTRGDVMRSYLRLESIGRNVRALALFWLLSFGFVQFGLHQLGGWPATEIGQMLGCAAGVAIQLRARLAAYFVAAMVAFSASELIVHLYFGIRAAQGAPTHFAGMGAALLSIALGASIARTNAGKIAV